MGTLPSAPPARGQVEVAGAMVEVRSLTRAEALAIKGLEGQPESDATGEVYLIARGLDLEGALMHTPAVDAPEAEAAMAAARDWWLTADGVAVEKLAKGIGVVSRLMGEDGKAPNSPPSGPSSKES